MTDARHHAADTSLYSVAVSMLELQTPIVDCNSSDYEESRIAQMNYDYHTLPETTGGGKIRLPGLISRNRPGTPYWTGGRRVSTRIVQNSLGQPTATVEVKNRQETVEENNKKNEKESSPEPVVQPEGKGTNENSLPPQDTAVTQSTPLPAEALSVEETPFTPSPSPKEEEGSEVTSSASRSVPRRSIAVVDTDKEIEKIQYESQSQLKYILNASLPLLNVLPLPVIGAQCYRVNLPVEEGSKETEVRTFLESNYHSNLIRECQTNYRPDKKDDTASLRALVAHLPHEVRLSVYDRNRFPADYLNLPLKIGRHVDDANSLRSALWGGCKPFYLRACCYRLLEYFESASSLPSMSASTNVGFDLSTPMRGARAVSVSGVSPLQASASGSNFASNPVDRSPLTGSLASLPSPGNLVPNNSGGGNETVLFLRYDRILTDLAQRRRKYENYVRQYWTDAFYQPKTEHAGGNPDDSMNTFSAINNQNLNLNLVPHEREILNQIALDLPRHKGPLFHCRTSSYSLARVIFLFSQRHPVVGYVQGMDDIFYMFYLVFFTDALRTIQSRDVATGATDEEGDWTCIVEKFMSLESEGILVTEELLTSPEVEPNVLESLFELCFTGSTLSPTARQERPQQHVVPVLLQVEADTYFCAAQLISQLQDNYRPGQPGVRAAGAKIEYLLSREAPDLLKRCEENGLGVVDGCFQWLHCLLLRELPLPLSLLLWDTYKAASVEDVYNIHQCMCAALIIELRPHILSCRPELLVMLLKSPYASIFPEGFPSLKEIGEAEGESKAKKMAARRKQILWMEMLMADGYRIWRQHF